MMCFIRRLRVFAPFVLLVPSLAALGAAAGSWDLGYLAHEHYPMSALPLWAFVFGFPTGAMLGLVIGLGLSLLTLRLIRREVTFQPAVTPNA